MEQVFDILEKLVTEQILKGYAIGGATAAGLHGEPLATRDIGVFVFLDPPEGAALISLEPLYSRLGELGFAEFEEEGLLIADYPVQFLSASPGLEQEAVQEAELRDWDHHRTRLIRPEHLAAIALETGRPKDRARLVYLVSLPEFDRNLFYSVVERHGLLGNWQTWSKGLGID